MNARELTEKYEQYVIDLRREFHMHPELSLKEDWTRARIAEELKALGIPCEEVAGHNVVGVVDSGRPGKSIAIRADFDALPLVEEVDVPFKSQIPGCMHACGHDAHAACLLGIGRILNDLKDTFNGKVYLCFQALACRRRGWSC